MKILAWIACVAAVVAGFYFGITIGWVDGIKEIISGAQTTPVSGSAIAWGAVRSLVFGDLIIAGGFFLAWFLGAFAVAV